MNDLRAPARAYIAGLVCLAAGLALLALRRALPIATTELLLTAGLAACMALAWLFPIPFARRTKLYVDTAVTVAAVLLLAPGLAMVATGSGPLLAAAVRRHPQAAVEGSFNAAQSMLVALAGALLLAAAGWRPTPSAVAHPWPLLVLPLAAVVMHLLSVFLVATGIALQAGLPVRGTFRRALLEDPRVEALAQASLVAIGALAALVVDAYPWAVVLLVVPLVATYGTLRHQTALRQEAERARLTSDAGLAEAQHLAGVGSWEWDPATGRQAWSDEAYRVLGFAPRSLVPTYETFLEAIHPGDRPGVDRAMRGLRDAEAPLRLEYRVRLPDGTERLVHQRSEVRGDAERGRRVVGTIQDVTERRALEAQVAAGAERERRAAELAENRRRLAETREEERLRLARALHDGPVQDLLAISYKLAGPHRAAGSGQADGPPAARLDTLRQEVLGVVGELRGMIGELRPAGLVEFGLPTALAGYVASLQSPAGANRPEITLDLDPAAASLPSPLGIALFRAAQEAIRNAVRHAAADQIRVTLRLGDGEVLLRVEDDGSGFQVPVRLGAFVEAGHFGLVGLAERVDQVGGELAIDSSASGTTISVRVPVNRPEVSRD